MNAIPSRESQRAELARLLPAPAYPDLSADRQLLLKDDLMSHLPEPPARRSRKRLVIGIAAPLALGAAALSVAVFSAPSGTSGGSSAAPPTPRAASTGAAQSLTHVTNAAYTLDVEPNGDIKIAVHSTNPSKVDSEQFKRDLASVGVNALVDRSTPKCTARLVSIANRVGRSDWVFTIKRGEFNSNLQYTMQVFFPNGRPGPKGTIKGNTWTGPNATYSLGDILTVHRGSQPNCPPIK